MNQFGRHVCSGKATASNGVAVGFQLNEKPGREGLQERCGYGAAGLRGAGEECTAALASETCVGDEEMKQRGANRVRLFGAT